jgi:uncharacterized phage-associated protein
VSFFCKIIAFWRTAFGLSREAPYIAFMASALTAANRILEIAKEKGITLTPLQLMKLTYMSQGWMLGLKGKALFDDRIEAWKYGPVIPSLYQRTKLFGSGPITEQLPAPTGDNLDGDAEEILQSVVETYGRYSGVALSNLTHRPGSPWSQFWKEGVINCEIPVSAIRAHYDKLKDADRVTAA